MTTNFGKDILKTERLFQHYFRGCEEVRVSGSEGVTHLRCIVWQLAKAGDQAKNQVL